MVEQRDEEAALRLYRTMRTRDLIDLRHAHMGDLKAARLRKDAGGMQFNLGRLNAIATALIERDDPLGEKAL